MHVCVCVCQMEKCIFVSGKIEKPQNNGDLTLQDPGPYISQRDGEIVNK